MRARDTISFHYHNANPCRCTNHDAVIRAIATATGLGWDDVLTELYKVAMRLKTSPTHRECYEHYLQKNGWVKKKMLGRRMSAHDFCQALTVRNRMGAEGNENWTPVIACLGDTHLVAIMPEKDKELYRVWDIRNGTSGLVDSYWVKPSL